ncbi:fatty acid desaturase [Sphingorhabdus sp.]|uniref:fatty acid desaturase family protein n=1 Tax=Sphingorhabdus sp. TaxID=1902408 RepID=UPI0035930385
MSVAYLELENRLSENIEMTNMTFTTTGTAGDTTSGNDVAARADRLKNIADDKAMLRAVTELTRDLGTANPRIFWSDFLFSAFVGYAGLAVAILASPLWLKLGAGFISVLALYRAGGFIHEVSHMKHSSVPGFRFGFNAVIGVPLLVPSYMYEGVHNLHHARTRYGTNQDPEYLPLALMKPWTLPVFILLSILAPFALLFRNAVLAPLSLFIPPLRKRVVEQYSGLVINPEFRRRPAEGEARRNWIWQETAASLWAIALLAGVLTGFIPLDAFVIFLIIVSAVAVLNQIRTLVAHLWENDGEPLSVTAQFLDSVNVPPPAILPALWAPVGLRYHALHHLLPSVPYHALGEAHRRLSAELAPDSAYHRANYKGLPGLAYRLAKSTVLRGA